jgi:MarR family transcriptional regulator, 2-MHQ and catechol-resistance regulon repressor
MKLPKDTPVMGTYYQGTPEEIRAANSYIKLQRASDSAVARVTRHLAISNLTFSQYGVLDLLFHLGPLPLGQIAIKTLKSDGNMTTVVDNLERRDLVRRERNLRDRRVVTVSLTDTGRQLISEVLPQHIQAIVEEMSVLTPEEQEILGRLCRKLGRQERQHAGQEQIREQEQSAAQ